MKRAAESLVATFALFKGRAQIVSSIRAALAQIDTTHNLLLKNFYWVSLERAGERWQITHMRIENLWHRGDPKVLFQ